MKIEERLRVAEKIVHLLDNQFGIGPFKFGIDPLIGLIPVIGDIIPLALSVYLISIAVQEKVDPKVIGRMVFYAIADFVIGSTPIFGDVADFFFKSHLKNLSLLKQELGIGKIVKD